MPALSLPPVPLRLPPRIGAAARQLRMTLAGIVRALVNFRNGQAKRARQVLSGLGWFWTAAAEGGRCPCPCGRLSKSFSVSNHSLHSGFRLARPEVPYSSHEVARGLSAQLCLSSGKVFTGSFRLNGLKLTRRFWLSSSTTISGSVRERLFWLPTSFHTWTFFHLYE